MELKDNNYTYQSVIQLDEVSSSRKYLAKVFTWMFVALGISGFFSYEFATNINLLKLIVSETGFTGLGIAIVFAPLAFCLLMNAAYTRLSYPVLVTLFIAYAAVTGISLSVLALIYATTSIMWVFVGCSAIFAIMAVAGYTTQLDLTKMGSILVIGMIGIVLTSVLNFFIHSSQLDYIISFIGIIVFTGLTAYYIQTLKRIGEGVEYGSAEGKKLVIIGAFVLYTNFINLFISLLRVFGRRR